jgi:hypothetical protein
MQVQNWPIDKVTPYDRNPRDNDGAVEATANSIKQFGWQQPLVVDKDGVLIVGHTRLLAAQSLGMDKVPVVVADKLTDEKVKAYRLADNKTGELAKWDFEALSEELAGIEDIDMGDFGFTDFDYDEDAGDLDDYDEPDDGSTKLKLAWPKHSVNLTGIELEQLNDLYDHFEDSGTGSFVSFLYGAVFDTSGGDA